MFLLSAAFIVTLAIAIQLLEQEKERGFVNINDVFLLIYLYCLNGNVATAEPLSIRKR